MPRPSRRGLDTLSHADADRSERVFREPVSIDLGRKRVDQVRHLRRCLGRGQPHIQVGGSDITVPLGDLVLEHGCPPKYLLDELGDRAVILVSVVGLGQDQVRIDFGVFDERLLWCNAEERQEAVAEVPNVDC